MYNLIADSDVQTTAIIVLCHCQLGPYVSYQLQQSRHEPQTHLCQKATYPIIPFEANIVHINCIGYITGHKIIIFD